MNALIFVDTNILLDFYRVRSGGGGLELLNLIEAHKDVLITGSQVEMEYKKNRQRVILEALKAQKTPDWNGLTSPAFLADAKPAQAIAKSKKTITTQQKKLMTRIANILEKPSVSDPVFKTLSRVFKNDCEYNLTRDKKIRFKIRNLARKRFVLGYPPRKQNDTSIGDAVNWEWIVHCAEDSGKDIIIVTRDTDYGVSYGEKFFLNDWLLLEFKERISQRRKIVLTDRLARAFKLVEIRVSAKAEQEEKDLVEELSAKLPSLKCEATAIAQPSASADALQPARG
ncbi:MAG: PIN domain-containing protein [Gammaproteobacteria bacterium]